MQTCIHTDIHACMHTDRHPSMHAYIPTYIHTCKCTCKSTWSTWWDLSHGLCSALISDITRRTGANPTNGSRAWLQFDAGIDRANYHWMKFRTSLDDGISTLSFFVILDCHDYYSDFCSNFESIRFRLQCFLSTTWYINVIYVYLQMHLQYLVARFESRGCGHWASALRLLLCEGCVKACHQTRVYNG